MSLQILFLFGFEAYFELWYHFQELPEPMLDKFPIAQEKRY